jgi:hypothetical protein
MSFKLRRFFYLIISLVTGSFFFSIGMFSMFLPWSQHLQQETIRLITENTLILSLYGMGFVLIGLSIVIYTILATRRRELIVRTGNLAVTVDEAVVCQYLRAYWLEQFPGSQVPFHIKVKKNALQISAELPALPLEEQKIFLEKVKQDFTDLFGNLLGYPHDVHLIANFLKPLP